MTTSFFEVHAASTKGPAIVGKYVFPSLKTRILARLGFETPATWLREQAISQCLHPVHFAWSILILGIGFTCERQPV
jgi:hypothetical protein